MTVWQQEARRSGIRFVGHCDLGNGMQVMLKDDVLFVGRIQPGDPMAIVDVSDPKHPRQIGELPAFPDTWHTKCQVAGDLMLVNYEQRASVNPEGRTGFAVYDVSRPREPREVCYVPTGGRGIHRMWWAGERYAYLSGQPDGFRGRMLLIYDMKDPEQPDLVGRWWFPGLREGEEPSALDGGLLRDLHHGIPAGNHLYCGMWDAGFGIVDIADPTRPGLIAHVNWVPDEGANTHTALPLPGRKLAAVIDESITEHCQEPTKYLRLFDVGDPTAPRLLSRWGVEDEGHCARGGRFGPHNFHENRPGTFVSEDMLVMSYFNAGVRVVDISDPASPREAAYYEPTPPPGQAAIQTNDLFVSAEGLIFTTDRGRGGVHVLELERS